MIKVYGVHGSPFVRKVFIALDYKDVPYEIVPQMPFSGDEAYRKINPLAKVPTLVDGDLTVGDSKVICRYLESAHPEPALYPAGAADRAMADWYEELGGTYVTELATGIFFQRFMRPFAFKQEPDEELVAKIINQQLPPILDYLEGQLPEDGFVFGDFTLADLSLVSPFINAAYAKYEVDGAQYPRLAGLIARVKAVPQVAGVLQKEAESMGLS
ncbi:MAG: glutathione S-transferase family protein [Pseudomonadota bacterium]